MIRIGQAVKQAKERLEHCGVENAAHDAWRLLALVLRGDPLSLRLRAAEVLTDQQESAFDEFVERRARREPLQYIEGDAEFMGVRLEVNGSVLIPRQDTETLCLEALRLLKAGDRVLDIGTGSGAIAVALKHGCSGAAVTAVDISADALTVAKKNAEGCGTEIEFLKSDCFGALGGRRFDMIVSNPPYLNDAEMKTLMPEVCCEPEGALYGGTDGLNYYRRICREAPQHLSPGGRLLFEIGWQQKDAVSDLMRQFVGEPYALKDLSGNWRVVCAEWHGTAEGGKKD